MDTIYHADDFGISVEQSRRILACSDACGGTGALNSTSVLVTSPRFETCVPLLIPHAKAGAIHVGVHLNIVEGRSCAKTSLLPLLLGSDGLFRLGFVELLRYSVGSDKAELHRELVIEFSAQIRRFLEAFPERQTRLRVDSHQHFHLIPIVFDALFEAVAETNCALEYLRIPAEPLGPYLATPRLYGSYPPINGVKNAVLNTLWRVDRSKFPEWHERSATFFGIMLSGRMELVTIDSLLNRFRAKAGAEGRALEVLFHPGGVDNVAECLNPALEGFVAFYRSPHRRKEAEALQGLAEQKIG